MGTELTGLLAGDDPDAWRRLGFAVDPGGICRVGALAVELDGAGGGLRGWTLRGSEGPDAIDGLATTWRPHGPAAPAAHPNGAMSVDHVVVFTDARDRTVDAMVQAGGDERRRAGPPAVPVEMAFVRFGAVIVEVAQTLDQHHKTARQEGAAAAFWGLVGVVDDLDALADSLGPLLGAPRPAVQPGRRIATVQPEAGLGVALALMTPR